MRFFLGDDNGQLKSVTCTRSPEKEWKIETTVLDDGGMQGKTRAVQRLAVKPGKVALARCDGSAALFCLEDGAETVQVAKEWQERRFKPSEHKYIGLGITDNGVISCSSTGHLRSTRAFTDLEDNPEALSLTTSIPSRLSDWHLSNDSNNFAYGGDEVEISVWDTTRAFDQTRRLLPESLASAGTKRKSVQKTQLIEGEIWRAKNVSNDSLNLRQPVHNTSLTFLAPVSGGMGPAHHILAGTRLGSIRRYDTRAARKPVADWKDIGKVGGIRKVQKGNSEHEAFVADHGSNLFALDLRTGRPLYAYKGISGAISSLTSTSSSLSPPLVASTSLDRFFRLHSAFIPGNSGAPLDKKGEVVGKAWIKSAADCVAWDGVICKKDVGDQEVDRGGEGGEEGDVWAGMQDVGDEDGSSSESDEGRDLKIKRQRAR